MSGRVALVSYQVKLAGTGLWYCWGGGQPWLPQQSRSRHLPFAPVMTFPQEERTELGNTKAFMQDELPSQNHTYSGITTPWP